MYNFKNLEKKWQKKWEEKKIFEVKENFLLHSNQENLKKKKIFEMKEDKKKKKYYVLDMFPYPSGAGLHMGHAFVFSLGDIFARFKRMQGFNVLYPIGYDALGLPAENAAIKNKTHPREYTKNSIKNFMKQQKAMGWSYDWSRLVNTSEPEFYKWDQWIFLKMLEKGIAYRKKAPVNFCEKCDSVLANEQVVNGCCWRHEDTQVEIKHLEQWFFRITDYAEELLEGLEKINWPENAKKLQRNWIGKSYGTEIEFEISWDEKTNFILLHGHGGSSNRNFFPWLKKELEKRGYKVSVTKLPNPDSPNIDEKVDYILKHEKINEDTIILGHSLGGAVALQVLEKLDKPIKKLILVAGAIRKEFNFDKIKKNVKDIIYLRDERDTVIPKNAGEMAENLLGAKVINFRAQEIHICDLEEPMVLNHCLNYWKIFTTRPDTIFGVTFMVVSAQHSKLMELVTKEQKKEVEKFLRKIKSVSEKEFRDIEKEGVFTGSYAVNPLTKEKVPIYAGNFVVADYGSGMVMAVPAHDQRDFEFAKKYGIKIKQVIAPYIHVKREYEIRKDKPIVKRNVVITIVKNPKTNKFLMLKNSSENFFVIGGVEDKNFIEEAKREVLEETGYKNLKFIKEIGWELHNSVFAKHKDENRYGINHCFYFEIEDEKQEKISKGELAKHTPFWAFKEEVSKLLNNENQIYYWKIFNQGERAYTGEGKLINSSQFNGLWSEKAKEEITKYLEKKKLGKRTINYKLRDWLISRQRYWGTPIPIIYCDKCGIVPVPEKNLPVILPEKVKFGKGNPLATNKEFVDVKCPKCGGKARRETDTMDTFVNSSWYFLRYTDSKNKNEIFDRKKVNYWCPIDQYIGGPEHITMHLIYIRFYTKFLRDLGLFKFDEPALKYFTQGIVHGSDGEKMSKSKGNVVEPLSMIEKYGADTLRLALVSFASSDNDIRWDEKIVLGSHKFLNKVYKFFSSFKDEKIDLRVEARINKAIKEVAEDIENFRHNLAVIKIRQLFEYFSDKKIDKKNAEKFLLMLHVYCPFITEEIWEKIGNAKNSQANFGATKSMAAPAHRQQKNFVGKNFISLSRWPKAGKIDERLLKQDEMVEKLIGDINNIIRILKSKGEKKNKVKIFAIPNEVEIYSKELGEIKKRINLDVKVFSIKDAKSEGKTINAKPGKPGILME